MSLLIIFLGGYYSRYGNAGKGGEPYLAWLFLLPIVWLAIVYVHAYFRAHEINILKYFEYKKPLDPERVFILTEKIPYYNALSLDNKKIFRQRVHHFLLNKTFTSDDTIEVTEEMKVMVAATVIQILFGLEAYYLSHFRNIHVVSDTEPQLKSLHKAEDILINWDSFKAGYSASDDGYNPGLKIMAMALSLEHQLNKLSKNMFNSQTFKTFHKIYKKQAEKFILSGKSKYNDYKQVDRNEYFSVAVEYFFERPQHFYANQPQMYIALSKLLRQDPLGNYTYKRK